MLKLFDQKEKKKKLYLDSVNKFESTIKKQFINHQTIDKEVNKREVKFADLSNIPKIQNELILSQEEREKKIGLMDKNFRDLISLRSLEANQNRQKNHRLKSSKKLINDSPQLPKIKKSCSLPRLKKSQSKISDSKSMGLLLSNSSHQLSSLIEQLESSKIIVSHEDSFLISKENFKDLINYLILLSQTDSKKKFNQIMQNHKKFSDLKEVSEKIFKLREKRQKCMTLKIDDSKINFHYLPLAGKSQKTCTMKHSKKQYSKRQQILKKEKEQQDLVSIKVIHTGTKLLSGEEITQCDDFNEKESENELKKIKQKYKEIKIDLKEYTQYLTSLDFKSKLSEISTLSNVQEIITKEIKQFYSTVINDPLLVPSLKEKLMINLISKLLKNFKINTSDFSQMAEQKSQQLKKFINKMKDWIDKYELKVQYLVQSKKLFVIDTRLLLSTILEVEELLKTFDRKSENEDIIVRKVAKSCRKVILKYRNDPYFFTQDY